MTKGSRAAKNDLSMIILRSTSSPLDWVQYPNQSEERVARYATEHKQATRQRIIDTAGHRFKQDGIDGSGIATLMADAGLTNGAFYAHFASKNELITHTIIEEMRAQHERLTALAPGRK